MGSGLLRSAGANWAGLLVTAVVSFFVSGYLVQTLGRDTYGLWALATAVASHLMIFDGGVRSALVRLLPAARSAEEVASLLAAGQRLLLRYSLVGVGVMTLVYLFSDTLFALSPSQSELFRILLLIAVVDGVGEVISGTFDAAIAAKERYDGLNLILIGRTLLTAIIVVAIIASGFDIVTVALGIIGARLCQRLVMGRFAFSLWGVRGKLSIEQSKVLEKLRPVMGSSFLMLVSSRVIHQMDTVVAGVLLSSKSVALCALAVLVTDQLRQLGHSASAVLLPRFSNERATPPATRHELLLRWTRIGALLAVSFVVPLYLTGADLAFWWVGERSDELRAVMTLFGLSFIITFPSFGLQHALLASDSHRKIAKALAGEALTNLVISVALAKMYGVWGIALGTLLAAAFWRGIFLPLIALSLLQISTVQYFGSIARMVCLGGAGYFASLSMAALLLTPSSLSQFVLFHAAAGSIYAAFAWKFLLDERERGYLSRQLARASKVAEPRR